MTESLEGALAKVIRGRKQGLFLLKVDHVLTRETAEFLHKSWNAVGGDRYGKLLVMQKGMDLSVIGDAELRDLGLVRVEKT